ncbi:MAG: PDZ domain-containing protein [Gammaproteobacteria bacterium]|nr:PDZ domain-containing protein [Gammaproteobacteria bacterium]
MSRITIAMVASLVAAFAAGAWVTGFEPAKEAQGYVGNTASDETVPISERLLRLEQVIVDEREARLVLEDQLLLLIEDLERLESTRDRAQPERPIQVSEIRGEQLRSGGRPRDYAAVMRMYQDRRVADLVSGGFSEDEARRLLKRESEAQYKAMEAAYLAQRDGEAVDRFNSAMNAQSILRAEIGDSEYERFLTAQDEPTTVRIMNVLDGSPGSSAGLQAGDNIVSYNGERTFSMLDVRGLTMQGNSGEDVIIEIDRDGVRMQLNIPRGPIGVSGNGAMVRSVSRWGG